jgi:hypothetical protein
LSLPVERIEIGPILVEPVTCRRAWDLLSGSEAGRVETSLTRGNVPRGMDHVQAVPRRPRAGLLSSPVARRSDNDAASTDVIFVMAGEVRRRGRVEPVRLVGRPDAAAGRVLLDDMVTPAQRQPAVSMSSVACWRQALRVALALSS